MHSFIKVIGFEGITQKEIDKVIEDVIEFPNYIDVAKDSQKNEFYQYSKEFGENIGISVCGSYQEDNTFKVDYYFPYIKGTGLLSSEVTEIEKHTDKESYAVICDEIRVGVNLIYYMQNVVKYLELSQQEKKNYLSMNSVISSLSMEGKIILPMQKTKVEVLQKEKRTQIRKDLIVAARNGDEEAIENLTLEDIDTYSIISKRIQNEDILSIVDTCFMPYGIESDKYSVIGEIINYYYVENYYTKQKICIMTIDTNDLIFDVAINEKNLLGQPEVGRRFKGTIWLQGELKFEN